MSEYDAVVIGSGSGGSAFAKRAAALGAKVAVVEMADLGGVCVNRGCVPKKLMWHSAHERREAEGLATAGFIDEPSKLDYGVLHQRVHDHVTSIRESYEETLGDLGIEIVRGRAELIDGGVRVDDRELKAPRTLIACGGKPTALDIPGWELCDTSDTVFGWTERPQRLLIVGGGYIGVEFATVFSGLGSDVTIADVSDHLLDGFDPAAIELVEKHLGECGVRHIANSELTGVERSGDSLLASLGDERMECDAIIVAIGRTPRIDELGGFAGDLERADNGSLEVSEAFETSRAGVFAVGDAANRMPLTPVARRDGEWLANHLFGEEAGERLDLGMVATATYCDPPVAQVGRTDAEEDHGLHVESGSLDPLRNGLFANHRAKATYLHKVLSDDDGKLRGVVLVSRTAPDEISWAATLLASGAKADVLARPGSVHPTFAEELIG